LRDILAELEKPDRDSCGPLAVFEYDACVRSVEDPDEGIIVNVVATNITVFGAFVDIDPKQDGLVHASQMANYHVSDLKSIVKVFQKVKVKVLEADTARK